jgi:cell division protein FtsN
MSKNSNRPGNEFPIFAGILLGIVMGLALAGTIAWFVIKKNKVYVPAANESVMASKPAATPENSSSGKPAASGTASAANDGKPRFEFYKELSGKPDSTAGKKNDRHDPALNKQQPVASESSGTYFLQEGAYSSMDDAEKVKAKLALLGIVSNVQPAMIPDKGLWYRVRMGPYKNTAEMNESLASLKLNGVHAVPVKVR